MQTDSGADFLSELEAIIAERLASPDHSSYTARLAAEGIERIAQKVGEEAVEVAIASVTNSGNLKDEAADLLYHLLVLLAVKKISLADIGELLAGRHRDRQQAPTE